LAIAYRRWDVTPVKRYAWEDDDSVPEWFPQQETPLDDRSRDVSSVDDSESKITLNSKAKDKSAE
jgi:hypothetical protein